MITNWTMDLENIIFSLIKKKCYEDLKVNYPDISFTTVNRVSANPKFPNCYIHLLPMVEYGNDLEGTTVNAVMATVQVDVTTNTSFEDAKTVIYTILSALKEMRFDITTMPTIVKEDNDIYRATMRGRRMIGSGDVI